MSGFSFVLEMPRVWGSCPKKQEPAVRRSRVHPTELTCLQELLKRLQDRHVDCAEAVAKKAERRHAQVQDEKFERRHTQVQDEKFERRHAQVQDEKIWS